MLRIFNFRPQPLSSNFTRNYVQEKQIKENIENQSAFQIKTKQQKTFILKVKQTVVLCQLNSKKDNIAKIVYHNFDLYSILPVKHTLFIFFICLWDMERVSIQNTHKNTIDSIK